MTAGETLPSKKIFEILEESELWASELYNLCSKVFKEDCDFWTSLEKDEIKHFNHLKTMEQIFDENPQSIYSGRQITEITIQTLIKSMQMIVPELKMGKIPKKRMLAIAKNIEDSIIESKYKEILTSKDSRFQALLKEISLDTYRHRKILLDKMSELS